MAETLQAHIENLIPPDRGISVTVQLVQDCTVLPTGLDSSKRALIRFLPAQEAERAAHGIRARISVKGEPHGNGTRREKGQRLNTL
jgi:hypothetical protein